jgi:hypothetical protein
MATHVLIHGAGDVGWYWHLVEREVRTRHGVVVMLECIRAETLLGAG